MGEVYRAVDRRLNRAVAIKVVAERHRDRPDLHQRFKTEMTAIAALNHPHICQLYDVGEHDSAGYLVMELLDGDTLAARLARPRTSRSGFSAPRKRRS
jgi:eukaryotic-like serine/threonine-protein kinase